ncbi:uncharacterized protein LOC134188492 [Corticium candelabrum]|uniref:uncharacterized protein LOC134188492 n=1 Tax=Corticium candelabrum TaxID=121492 RepID=UPI002E26B949|nr:uncharacterized protein LOC134188492 [Corticium candelabrum]
MSGESGHDNVRKPFLDVSTEQQPNTAVPFDSDMQLGLDPLDPLRCHPTHLIHGHRNGKTFWRDDNRSCPGRSSSSDEITTSGITSDSDAPPTDGCLHLALVSPIPVELTGSSVDLLLSLPFDNRRHLKRNEFVTVQVIHDNGFYRDVLDGYYYCNPFTVKTSIPCECSLVAFEQEFHWAPARGRVRCYASVYNSRWCAGNLANTISFYAISEEFPSELLPVVEHQLLRKPNVRKDGAQLCHSLFGCGSLHLYDLWSLTVCINH